MREVVCNTSPFQYLFQTEVLSLLPALYGRVVTPSAVAEELDAGRARGVPLPDVRALPWVEVRSVREPRVLSLAADLGPGEREVLALALESPGALAILDDGLARRYALHLGLNVTGTLGVLLKAKQTGALKAVAPVIARLEALRFRVDAATHRAVLELAGEHE